MYAYLETKYTAQVATGLDLSNYIGGKQDVFAWWIPIVGVMDGLIVLGGAAFGVLSVINYRKSRKKAAEA